MQSKAEVTIGAIILLFQQETCCRLELEYLGTNSLH